MEYRRILSSALEVAGLPVDAVEPRLLAAMDVALNLVLLMVAVRWIFGLHDVFVERVNARYRRRDEPNTER